MSAPTNLLGTPGKRRSRRSRAQIEQLERQIFEVLSEDHPQSVRHVFYRLTDPRLLEPVEKTERGYAQVQDRITKMRRAGTLHYGWITDATRRGYHVETFQSPKQFIREVAGLYRRNIWESADHYVEVWAESRSIAGVIEADCEELAVSLYPAGGFASVTLAYEAAQYIKITTRGGSVPAEIIYIGDYDPAGVLIDRAIERELRKHLPQDFRLNFYRLAITPEQIAELGLPTKPRKPSERRERHITKTVEAEAMPSGVLRRLVRERIESFLPPHALKIARTAEESERAALVSWAAALG